MRFTFYYEEMDFRLASALPSAHSNRMRPRHAPIFEDVVLVAAAGVDTPPRICETRVGEHLAATLRRRLTRETREVGRDEHVAG